MNLRILRFPSTRIDRSLFQWYCPRQPWNPTKWPCAFLVRWRFYPRRDCALRRVPIFGCLQCNDIRANSWKKFWTSLSLAFATSNLHTFHSILTSFQTPLLDISPRFFSIGTCSNSQTLDCSQIPCNILHEHIRCCEFNWSEISISQSAPKFVCATQRYFPWWSVYPHWTFRSLWFRNRTLHLTFDPIISALHEKRASSLRDDLISLNFYLDGELDSLPIRSCWSCFLDPFMLSHDAVHWNKQDLRCISDHQSGIYFARCSSFKFWNLLRSIAVAYHWGWDWITIRPAQSHLDNHRMACAGLYFILCNLVVLPQWFWFDRERAQTRDSRSNVQD